MIIREREILCTPAASQVHAMGRIAKFQRGGRHTSRITGIARPLEPVNQNQFTARFAFRPLGIDSNLYARFGFVNTAFDWPALFAFGPRPEISRDGCQMRIFEEGSKRLQTLFLRMWAQKENGSK